MEDLAEEFAYVPFERLVQCCLLGPPKAGKTTFLRLIAPTLGHFAELSDSGLNKVSGVQTVGGTSIAFRIYDVPGRAGVDDAQHAKILRESDAALIVCDINDPGSIEEATRCAAQLGRRYPNCTRFLVFNRDDGEFDRQAPAESRLQAISQAAGCAYARTSCLERQGIEDALYSFATHVLYPTQTYMYVGASQSPDSSSKGRRRAHHRRKEKDEGCAVL